MIVTIPVKLKNPKSRLAGFFSLNERRKLVLAMLNDVVEALEGYKIVVITSEKLNGNFKVIREEKPTGLTKAVKMATDYALSVGEDSTLFIPADVPTVTEDDIENIVKLGDTNNVVISASEDSGITSLFRKPPNIISEKFSSKSFYSFMEEIEKNGIKHATYTSPTISLDIDTIEDVIKFMEIGKGTRTYKILKEIGINMRREIPW